MSYLETYYSRINHMGQTTAERIRNGGKRSYNKWLAESPHTVRQLSVERGIYFDGIIIRNKDKEYEKIMKLHVKFDTDIKIGDIMNWILDDGTIEKWLVLQEEKKTNGTYRTFWIIRCNYLLRWVDENGHVQQSWGYVVSSVDSKIKGNYRTWHNLISPQPNKYAEIIMPRYEIKRSTNFIIENESWQLVEYDHTSVPGTVYLSLTEGKINSLYDDVSGNLADINNIAQYTIDLPQELQTFKIGTAITPIYTLNKNGIPSDEPIIWVSENKTLAKYEIIDGVRTLVGKHVGEVQLRAQLSNYPDVDNMPTITVKIIADESPQIFDAYIEGPNMIRLSYTKVYTLIGLNVISDNVTWSFNVDDLLNDGELNLTYDQAIEWCKQYATLVPDIHDCTKCSVIANNKNKLTPAEHPIVLQATYNNNIYTQAISIIPIW